MKNATNQSVSSVPFDKQDTSAHTQRLQILAHLKLKPLNTLQLRELGFMTPAPRIMELRRMGYPIKTVCKDAYDHCGILHKRVAIYSLITSPESKEAV